MRRQNLKIVFKLAVAAGIAATLFGCETLKSIISIERPEVHVEGAELTALSFDGAEVTVELAIENPNTIGISMSGFSYELLIEGNRFLDGDIADAIQIDPQATSALKVPVAFGFRDLMDTVQAIGDADEAAYAIILDLRFELPILGPVSVPVRTDGTFPVVRIPTVRLSSVHLDSIGLTGAELRLDVAIHNPNAFGLSIDSLTYEFAVESAPWMDGTTSRSQNIDAGRESTISLPFNLRFLSVGRTVRNILTGADDLDYQFDASARIGADLPLIPGIELPVSLSGTVPLRR